MRGDNFPFQSLPTAFLKRESGPCDAMMNCCRIQYATAAIKQNYTVIAVGAAAKWFSPIQPVVKGNSDSQNNRCRLAQSIGPVTL